jgi:hypothetical protein
VAARSLLAAAASGVSNELLLPPLEVLLFLTPAPISQELLVRHVLPPL